MGKPIILQVSKIEKDSTYKKIIDMVKKAQDEKSPFIRLADRYSTLFTLITLAIAGFAFLLSRNLDSVLAVLVIATPCPLIIATPIALLGGVSKAAKKKIIVKKLASL
jgi:cation transport ATPase